MTADWHLRKQVPICRNQTEEEWLESQRSTIRFIINEANKKHCDIFVLGDTFDTPKVDDSIKNMLAFECLSLHKDLWIYFLIGNHESLYHNIDLMDKTSIYTFVLDNWPYADITHFFDGAAHFNKGPKNPKSDEIFLHMLTFPSEKEFPPR